MRRLYRRLFEIKQFSERNPYRVGAIGIAVLVAALLISVNYSKLTFLTGEKEYSAYFAEAGGLETNSVVEVSGARIGRVSSVTLDGPKVLVKFHIPGEVRLGDRTEAAVKLKTLLGSKLVELTPRGEGRLTGPIPLERTTSAYQLPDALGDLSTTVAKLNTDQLSQSLAVVANEFSGTRPQLKAAAEGVSRFSQTLDERDKELRNLLTNANKVTSVLAKRSDEVVNLVGDTNSLLIALKEQDRYLSRVLLDDAHIAWALGAVVDDNHAKLAPALEKLNTVVALLNNRKGRIQEAVKGLDSFALALGEAVASGPFFKAYLVNLVPGQFIQPFIDAAFSDLGLDPATQLPSQLTDPQTGQAGAAPVPRAATAHSGRHHRQPWRSPVRAVQRCWLLPAPTGTCGATARRTAAGAAGTRSRTRQRFDRSGPGAGAGADTTGPTTRAGAERLLRSAAGSATTG